MKKIFLVILILFLFVFYINFVFAKDSAEVHFFYVQGCIHCEKGKLFLEKLEKKYPEIELNYYEISFHPENRELLQEFCQRYNTEPLEMPMTFIGKNYIIGYKDDVNTGKKIEEYIQKYLQEGIEEIGKPEIPEKVKEEFSLAKIVSLAAVDAVNPCALAVLSLMLIAILTYNPEKRRNILLAGLAFTTSVFIAYFFYGAVIIKFFQLVQALSAIRLWLYKILGFAAIGLGVFNIRSAFQGGASCKVSPRVDRFISKITGPRGAFTVGLFVTIFLLPCTIGPYIIAGGILSAFGIVKIVPWLLLYNLIFVLPMLAISLIIYLGTTKIEDISRWEARNMKYLDFITGFIIFGLGLAMVFGWV